MDRSEATDQPQAVKSPSEGRTHFRVSTKLARRQTYTNDGYLKSACKDRPDESGLQHETLRLSDKEQTGPRYRINVGKTKTDILTEDNRAKK